MGATEDGSDGSIDERGRILESDLDLLLVLDARSEGPLVRFLISEAGLHASGPVRVVRSAWRRDGRETDVEVSWDGGSLLIENKVDHHLSAGQAESYRAEVERRRADGQLSASVLVCPERRRGALGGSSGLFDAVVSFEQLAEITEAHPTDRLAQASSLWLSAAAQPAWRPRPDDDPVRSAWGDGYREAVASLDLGRGIVGPGPGSLRTATATEAHYGAVGVDPPAVWKLFHDVVGGVVQMEVNLAGDPLPAKPPTGVHVRSSSQTHFLATQAPPMTFELPATDQIDALRVAVAAISTLRAWAQEHLAGHEH